MSGILDYMQLCRLCLVKDKVNVPIFGEATDVRQIFLKITACLPVKVSQDDNLPKKICDTCLYKVDLLYQFWNTTANAEKQLVQWLGEIGVEVNLKSAAPPPLQMSHAHPHSIQPEAIILKEERHESADAASSKMVYGAYNQAFAQSNSGKAGVENDVDSVVSLNSKSIEAPSETTTKRTRGRPPVLKKEQTPATTTSTNTKPSTDESMDEDDSSDRVGMQDDSDDSMEETGGRIAKEEAESEEEYEDNPESLEPTTFVGVPSDAACDTDQPGPSGLNKQPVSSTDTGLRNRKAVKTTPVKLKCEVCSKEFTNRTKYRKHKRNHAERKFPCKTCGKMFRFAYQTRAHAKCHSVEAKYKCGSCNKGFKTKYNLTSHERRHISDYSHKCDECGKGFYHNNDYREHYEVHHKGLRYECKECEKIFMTLGYYNIHMKTHDPLFTRKKRTRKNALYICDICGKTVTAQSTLKSHIMIHTGERPFVCNICGKAFNKREMLKVHQRTHNNERPYSCTQCDKSFTQRSSLVIHLRYHTGQRPYKCNICSKDFVSKSLLNNHSKTHGVKLVDL